MRKGPSPTPTTGRPSMPYNFVVDTYAWVEYLIGSPKGTGAKKYIEGGRAATPTIVLMELRKWFLRELEAERRTISEMNEAFDFIRASTVQIDLDEKLARVAGETDFVMKKKVRGWPLADSIVYATATTNGATVVTGDPHFKPLEHVVML